MKMGFTLGLALAFTSAAFAGLPEGAFRGRSSLIDTSLFRNDVMALLIKKDPAATDSYMAVLAEYDRVPLTNLTRRTAITKWVPRLYAYRIDKVSELEYAMKPLKVTPAGAIEVDASRTPDQLILNRDNTLNGAVVSRYGRTEQVAGTVEETIRLNGRVGSTWEAFVPGSYYGTNARSGSDYFNNRINMVLNADRTAVFSQEQVRGTFSIQEAAPGMFTFSATNVERGADQVTPRIGVFIDIVNWKPLFTTDELLLIDTEDASNVGFYYERH